MSDQFHLFLRPAQPQPARVVDEKHRAIEQVERNADDVWLETALAAVRKTCEQKTEFISDDIWEIGQLESTREDRALGPVMLRASRLGWCRKTDRVRPSKRSHGSGKPVWRSLL